MTSENQQAPVSSLVKYSVYLGIFLTRLFDVIPWIWGNFSVYVISYLHARGDESYDVLNNWLVMLTMSTYNVGLLLGGWLGKKFGDIPIMFVGSLLFNGGLFLSYTAIDYSSEAVCFGLGAMSGFTTGIVQCNQLSIAVRWTKQYHGLVTSWVSSFNVVLSMVVNLAITWYINPHNLKPDSTAKGMAIFTDKDLINMVPPTFLQLAVWSTTLNAIGFMLLRDRPGRKFIFLEIISTLKSMCKNSDDEMSLTKSIDENLASTDNSTCIEKTVGFEETRCQTEPQYQMDETKTEDINVPPNIDIGPLQVLKRKDFYALWIYSAAQQYGFFIQSTYYKSFGLLDIPQDHFLTVVGMMTSVSTPIFSWFAGFSVDKIGVKTTMVAIMSLTCILGGFFYLTTVDKWLYLFSCSLYGGVLCTVYTLTPPCCVKLYGKTHFTSIIGLTFSSSFVLTFTAPPLAGYLIGSYGWFILFFTAAVASLVALVVLVWGLPER